MATTIVIGPSTKKICMVSNFGLTRLEDRDLLTQAKRPLAAFITGGQKRLTPAIISMVINLRQSSGKQTTERSRERRSAIKNPESEHQLMALIEHAQVQNDSAEHAALARS